MGTTEIRKRIWQIPEGVPLKLENMSIRTTDSGKLLVIGQTDTIHFKNLSKEKILRELDELKLSFSDLRRSFNEFNEVIKNNNLIIEYQMAYDDGGKAGIGLCSELLDEITWYTL